MSIGGYEFEGPYPLDTNFSDVGAVYVVSGNNAYLDVGQTDKLGERIPSHERRDCWLDHANERDISIYAHQDNSESSRLDKESQLRSVLKPACGER